MMSINALRSTEMGENLCLSRPLVYIYDAGPRVSPQNHLHKTPLQLPVLCGLTKALMDCNQYGSNNQFSATFHKLLALSS